MPSDATIDDVMNFIRERASKPGQLRDPFTGRSFHIDIVGPAVKGLHDLGELLDLELYDVKGTKGLWNCNGVPNLPLARKATKAYLKIASGERPLNEVLPAITYESIIKTPISRYGTTLKGMLCKLYRNSPYLALKDLLVHDTEYLDHRNLLPQNMNNHYVMKVTELHDL